MDGSKVGKIKTVMVIPVVLNLTTFPCQSRDSVFPIANGVGLRMTSHITIENFVRILRILSGVA